MNTSAHLSAGTEGTKSQRQSASEGTGYPPEKVSWKAVYSVAERGKGRRSWIRIGTAFPNRDGSLTIRLDAVPLSGQLQVRDPFVPGPREADDEPLLGDKSAATKT
ncbi:MAG: hypothetical protein JNM40_18675 [Myxococcales bacterium]|nr:hypothetical protein [Myxococcales bacterium]